MAPASDEFADAASKWNTLFEILSNEPTIKIRGIVSPSGAGGGPLPGFAVLYSGFAAWRIEEGPMRFDELSICKRADTWDELRFYKNQLQAFSILEVHGRITLDPVFGTLICELIDIDGPVSDAELEDFANQLQNPVTFQDSRLGTFTLDRRIEIYEAQINWQKRKVSLTLNAMEPEELADLLAVARRLFDEQSEWTRKTKDYAVLELHEEKAADWQADFGVRLTAQKFKSFMKLNSISIKRDRTFEFWYDDGDLYGGHYITISGDFEHGLTEARIAG